MSRIFLIPGLGADSRVYKNIELPGHELIYTDWFEPSVNDTLADYSRKLIDQYDISNGDVVIGNSLGGMLAIEIAKKIKLSKVVLISSIKTISEAPWYFGFFRAVPIYKIIPDSWLSSSGFMLKYMFGDMSGDDLILFKSMLKNSSPVFMKWAMHAILNWDNSSIPDNLHHITGNKDLMFPYKRIRDATIIYGGTHIMIFDKAAEISRLLQEILH